MDEHSNRHDEIAANLATVRARIAGACAVAGRDDEVALVVVTKFFPESDVRLLAALGVTDVGENRHQEASVKATACADLDLRWHFVGSIQSNKAAAVAAYSDVVESVDRVKLVGALGRGAEARGARGRVPGPGQPRPGGNDGPWWRAGRRRGPDR
jgi:PLP dependent protein